MIETKLADKIIKNLPQSNSEVGLKTEKLIEMKKIIFRKRQ